MTIKETKALEEGDRIRSPSGKLAKVTHPWRHCHGWGGRYLGYTLLEDCGSIKKGAGRWTKSLRRWTLAVLMLAAAPAYPSPPSAYVLAAVADSRADGIAGPTRGIVAGAVAELGPVDLIGEVGWARTPKIDAKGGETMGLALALRVPRGPWYGEGRVLWTRLETPLYTKEVTSFRVEIGRGLGRWVWISAHWRLPDRTVGSAEDIGFTVHFRYRWLYQRFTVEELRDSWGPGVRIGVMLGFARGGR